MVDITNLLVSQYKVSRARIYTEFAAGETEKMNARLDRWLEGQAFAESAPSPQYAKVEIKGSWDGRPLGTETYDHVEWDFRFKHQLTDHLSAGTIQRSFNDGLLHIKRIPEVSKFNSAPNIFKTCNYAIVRVYNSEKGWVAKGAFPKNVSITLRLKERQEEISDIEHEHVAVYTDIRRDALAGFRAAEAWAKFRTLAVASKEHLTSVLQQEWKKTSNEYNAQEWMRSRTESTFPCMLELLPDVSTTRALASLKEFYRPGVLEAETALALETIVHSKHGSPRESRPVNYMNGSPIEIRPLEKKGEFDAVISFTLMMNCGPAIAQAYFQRAAETYLRVKLTNSSAYLRMYLPKAHRVVHALQEGNKNTILHDRLSAVREAIQTFAKQVYTWEEVKEPSLRKEFEVSMGDQRESHFKVCRQQIKQLFP